ncbi:MAG: class I SAM-dependent methyltransferase [Pirellulaceae bacterium]|nr:class I SAM-dependent methyltransferase [Pirellulaceae bacterium]
MIQTTAVVPFETSIDSHAGAAFFCRELYQRGWQQVDHPRVLIAGCGAGHEAVAVGQELRAEIEAVDVEDFVPAELKSLPSVRFQVASVCKLPFESNSFDAIFYHHVIEHVDDPVGSLKELDRVLKPGGWLFVGTPNRHRLISSIGAHEQSEWKPTLTNKLGDNWRDWKDRLTGRFENKYGAHAGFSHKELDGLLELHFVERDWLTRQYIEFKYSASRLSALLPLVTNPTTCWFAAPSIYVLCRKAAS